MSFLASYLPYLLRQADQSLSAPFYDVLTKHGVARSEWRVLAVLQELGELSVLDLASAALSPQPTVTNALRRLEQRGLVTRVQGTDDKRQRFISITPDGSVLARTLMDEATRLAERALGEAGDLSALRHQLKDLTAVVEAHIESQTEKVERLRSSDEEEAKRRTDPDNFTPRRLRSSDEEEAERPTDPDNFTPRQRATFTRSQA